MLTRLRFIQIGDVHLPSASTAMGVVDSKDPRFPTSLQQIIARQPLKQVFRCVHDLIAKGSADCVLFMGDLTDYGKLPGYQACTDYLAEALQLGIGRVHAHIPVGIVPGNHDIDRALARQPGSTAKFAPLNAALASSGLPKLPVTSTIKMEISANGASADVHLLNSCWGCGEEEHIPEIFRPNLLKAIDDTFAGAEAADAKKLYYDRQLDTPAFAEDTISTVVNDLSKMGSRVAVLVAHHNLLPQRMTRLAPYTELVNSGALRSSLLEIKGATIYLHGHIHDEPIEVISQPGGGRVVVVSAPEALSGFNYLEILYTKSQTPLCARVTPYRFDKSGVLRTQPAISCDLLGGRRRSSNEKLATFYGQLMQKRECYWSEVVTLAKKIDPSCDEEEITEMLELLNCDGSATIENYDLPCGNWIVRAAI